jgi:DNA-nicking Smr family endonuclease
MAKQRHLTPEERQLWRRFTKDVERPDSSSLSNESLAVTGPRELHNNHALHSKTDHFPAPHSSIPSPSPDITPGQMHQLSSATARRFRRRHQPIEATLDLHGYNRDDAQHRFTAFIKSSADRGLRVICVITGYGKMKAGSGILKRELPRWVNYPENRRFILSFDHAKPHEGGIGAWVFYLRRKERV